MKRKQAIDRMLETERDYTAIHCYRQFDLDKAARQIQPFIPQMYWEELWNDMEAKEFDVAKWLPIVEGIYKARIDHYRKILEGEHNA